MNKIILLLLITFGKLYGEKPQFWQTFEQPLGAIKKVEFSFKQQYRFSLSKFKMVDARFSLESETSLTSYLDGEIHITQINSRSSNVTHFETSYRLEIELNPHFELTKGLELKFRNRYEVRKQEQKFRQKHECVLTIDQGQFKNISINNEIFYDITLNKVTEYRFIPLELRFEIEKKHLYTVYFMVRWRKQTSFEWNPQFVLGSTLNW